MTIRVLALLLLVLGVSATYSQNLPDSVLIEGAIPVKRYDKEEWLKRYQSDIDRYILLNGAVPDKTCDVLFLGSSSINLWNSINSDLHPIKVIRRSYGGATIRDNIFNYKDIATGFAPKAIAIYIENDLGNYKEAISPGEIFDLFRLYINMLHTDYPDCNIYIISFKPSFLKADQLPDQLIINRLLYDYTQTTDYVKFIDITKVMYDSNGGLRSDIFEADRLHINAKGYELWTSVIKPILMKEKESK